MSDFAEVEIKCPGCGKVKQARTRGGLVPPDPRCQACFENDERASQRQGPSR